MWRGREGRIMNPSPPLRAAHLSPPLPEAPSCLQCRPQVKRAALHCREVQGRGGEGWPGRELPQRGRSGFSSSSCVGGHSGAVPSCSPRGQLSPACRRGRKCDFIVLKICLVFFFSFSQRDKVYNQVEKGASQSSCIWT